MKWAIALGLAALASGDGWLDATLHVTNPAAAGGRSLLTLGELVGPDAERSGASPRVVVLVRVTPADCASASKCAEVARSLLRPAAPDAVLLAFVVVPSLGAEERAWAASSPREDAVVAFDRRGVAARVLGLTAPGQVAVVFADGRRVETTLARGDDPAAPIRRVLATGR